jgi:prepilin-type N-terminal cleavage/methylation domain-containing protein
VRFFARNRQRATPAGFSLIETLVALAITGLALAAIADVFGTGLLGHEVSDAATTALSLAETELATAGSATPLLSGESDGLFAGRFHWRLTITRYDDKPDRNTASAALAAPAGAPVLYRVAVAVDWRDGLRQRQLALSTLRLGPPPP